MNHLELITLFFKCYRIIFIIIFSIHLLKCAFDNKYYENFTQSKPDYVKTIIMWTLFAMSWYF